ncbi:MAG: aquaporin, partial [Nitrososphaerales archaeon]
SWGAPLIAKISVGQGIVLEAIMTFLLVFTVFGTAVDPRAPKVGGFAIGLIVAIDVLVGGPFTGAAMNPARAIGPEIAGAYLTGSAAFTNWYVWWIGPIIGGIIAALLYAYVLMKSTN